MSQSSLRSDCIWSRSIFSSLGTVTVLRQVPFWASSVRAPRKSSQPPPGPDTSQWPLAAYLTPRARGRAGQPTLAQRVPLGPPHPPAQAPLDPFSSESSSHPTASRGALKRYKMKSWTVLNIRREKAATKWSCLWKSLWLNMENIPWCAPYYS